MAKSAITDEVWKLIEPVVPAYVPSRLGGRPPVPNRAALTGIVFVLRTGIGWEDLPKEMGCGSGMTCWRRLRDWQISGVWDKIHRVLLARLREADKLDFSRAVVDSSSVRAVFGGTTSDQTLRIAAKVDRSITSSSMRKESHWRRKSRRPTSLMARN